MNIRDAKQIVFGSRYVPRVRKKWLCDQDGTLLGYLVADTEEYNRALDSTSGDNYFGEEIQRRRDDYLGKWA